MMGIIHSLKSIVKIIANNLITEEGNMMKMYFYKLVGMYSKKMMKIDVKYYINKIILMFLLLDYIFKL